MDLTLSCHLVDDATANACNLVVYYNRTLVADAGSFGIRAAPLPFPAPRPFSAAYNATELKLNRTEPVYNSTLWMLLLFHGGSGCHVRFSNPEVTGINLPSAPNAPTQVRHTCVHWCHAQRAKKHACLSSL